MWLPHGLSKDTSLADLQASIQLCCLADPFGALDSSCSKEAFELSRPFPAELRMRVPALNPGQRCILRVKADPKVCTGRQACSQTLFKRLILMHVTGCSGRILLDV